MGGKAKGRKGFAVASQPTAEARRRGWEKRRANTSSGQIGQASDRLDQV